MPVFERGKAYTRAFISKHLGGGTQDYLPHVEGRVTYGAFSLDLNPQAPALCSQERGRRSKNGLGSSHARLVRSTCS
jgi:hypothetical protein